MNGPAPQALYPRSAVSILGQAGFRPNGAESSLLLLSTRDEESFRASFRPSGAESFLPHLSALVTYRRSITCASDGAPRTKNCHRLLHVRPG